MVEIRLQKKVQKSRFFPHAATPLGPPPHPTVVVPRFVHRISASQIGRSWISSGEWSIDGSYGVIFIDFLSTPTVPTFPETNQRPRTPTLPKMACLWTFFPSLRQFQPWAIMLKMKKHHPGKENDTLTRNSFNSIHFDSSMCLPFLEHEIWESVVLKLFKKDMFNESLDVSFGFGLGGCKKGSQINHIYICV